MPLCSKTVGSEVAIATILATTREALAQVDLGARSDLFDLAEALGDRQVFKKVWLGLAGIGHQSDVDAFAPLVRKAFNIAEDDESSIRITNGKHVDLASERASLLHAELGPSSLQMAIFWRPLARHFLMSIRRSL
jgi:hypothetical protein